MDAKKIQSRLGVAADGIMGPQTWAAMFRHMGATDAAAILGKEAAEHFQTFGLVSPLRAAHWFGQFTLESRGFTEFEENLNYSAERLCKVWPNRFPSLASAAPYAHRPEALANKVYAYRMGNGADEGWKYRGRGPQITGKENYANAQRRTGLPLLSNPDLAADPKNFVLLACDYWVAARCNEAADDDNLVLVTKRVNGGSNGIADRRQALERAKRILL
jgi:putative chitinase